MGAVYKNHSHNAIFNWTFHYASTIVPGNLNPALGDTLRDWVLNFVRSGDPNIPSVMFPFPRYGDEHTVVNVTNSGINLEIDNKRSKQCEWVMQALMKKLF